jgi:cytochrome c556
MHVKPAETDFSRITVERGSPRPVGRSRLFIHEEFHEMKRKWAVLAFTSVFSALAVTAISFADDDEKSPLHKVMEKVQADNSKITKGVRNAVMFKKSQKDVVAAAEDLVKQAKEAKPLDEGAKKTAGVEKAAEKWASLSDDFIKEAEEFAKFVVKDDVKQEAAKDAYKKVSKTCGACHDIFKKDE